MDKDWCADPRYFAMRDLARALYDDMPDHRDDEYASDASLAEFREMLAHVLDGSR